MPKPCDACYACSAVVYCRPDAAYLCAECDGKVHGANKLASRHERVWMCEVCEAAPAVVTCKADAASLCVACDTDIHSANPLAQRHERVPVQPLFESLTPSKPHGGPHYTDLDAEEAVSWLLPHPKLPANAIIRGSAAAAEEAESPPASPKPLQKKHPKLDIPADIFSDVDPFLDLDDAVVTGIQPDSLVPVLISECSQDTLEPSFATDFDKSGFSYGTSALSHSISCSSADAAVVPESTEISTSHLDSQGSQDFAANQPMQQQGGQQQQQAAGGQSVDTTVDREARVMRYKEKRQKRKFEKTIRYASRKAYAESRPRIKGRFAKRTDSEVESMLGADSSFGVVPSFS